MRDEAADSRFVSKVSIFNRLLLYRRPVECSSLDFRKKENRFVAKYYPLRIQLFKSRRNASNPPRKFHPRNVNRNSIDDPVLFLFFFQLPPLKS